VDPLWGLSRYAERLAASAPSFDRLAQVLAEPPGFAAGLLDARVRELTCDPRPDLVGITVPFPGNLYGALRTAAVLRRAWPDVPIALGGGYVNTELRDLDEPRLFDYVDYVTVDAGERPLLCLLDLLAGKRDVRALSRTFARVHDRVVYHDGAGEPDIPFENAGTPRWVVAWRAQCIITCMVWDWMTTCGSGSTRGCLDPRRRGPQCGVLWVPRSRRERIPRLGWCGLERGSKLGGPAAAPGWQSTAGRRPPPSRFASPSRIGWPSGSSPRRPGDPGGGRIRRSETWPPRSRAPGRSLRGPEGVRGERSAAQGS
jgi:hypothetical protein